MSDDELIDTTYHPVYNRRNRATLDSLKKRLRLHARYAHAGTPDPQCNGCQSLQKLIKEKEC